MAKKSVKLARSMTKDEKAKAKQRIIDWKRKNPAVSINHMADTTGLSKATIRYWIVGARNRGELTPDAKIESAVKAPAAVKSNGQSRSADTDDPTIAALEARIVDIAAQRAQLFNAEEALRVAIDALRQGKG